MPSGTFGSMKRVSRVGLSMHRSSRGLNVDVSVTLCGGTGDGVGGGGVAMAGL